MFHVLINLKKNTTLNIFCFNLYFDICFYFTAFLFTLELSVKNKLIEVKEGNQGE